jgi:hypothetical protein
VTKTQRKKWLFEQILRLRRAERESPENRDIVSVRSELENELGGTLTPSLAAALLGFSHTALRRWIRSGDVPVVITSRGRKEIPVDAVVDLYESVSNERESGRRRSHTLEPTMTARRERARSLEPRDLVNDEEPPSDPHMRARLRNLAYHRALARRLRRAMVNDARHVLWDWRNRGVIDPRYADEWESLLQRPIPEIRRALSSDLMRFKAYIETRDEETGEERRERRLHHHARATRMTPLRPRTSASA